MRSEKKRARWEITTWVATSALTVSLATVGLASQAGQQSGFSINTLPHGADVTLPGPATTLIPMSSRVQLSSTDIPQMVSFAAVVPQGGIPSPLKISIIDGKSKRVKTVQVKPGTPFLYSFRALSSITIIPELAQGQGSSTSAGTQLMVESDKPLSIAH